MDQAAAPRRRSARNSAAIPALVLLFALAMTSCGGTASDTPSGTGFVSVGLTDAPSHVFDNVWITVRDIWFNTNATAPFDNTSAGWRRFPLGNAVTIDLTDLAAGAVRPVFDNLGLPAGTYRQMLLFLASTESARTPSAIAVNLAFNNQVDVDATRRQVPLRVPNAGQGIRIAFEFIVTDNASRRLAIDFDVDHDIVSISPAGRTEFFLNPRLRVFDLDDAGAIVGFIDNAAAADNAALFAVLAQQFDSPLGKRVVRRTAAVDNNTGRFVLYPLGLGTYDVVIAGRNWETVIIKGVPATIQATPLSGATSLGTAPSPIPMTPGTDYSIGVQINLPGPTGASANLYQTPSQAGEVPYLIRFRSLDPLTGGIANLFLSAGALHLDAFNAAQYSGGVITLTTLSPVSANGDFTLAAEADLFTSSVLPGSPANVHSTDAGTTVALPSLGVAPPAAGNSITTNVDVPVGVTPIDNLFVFVTRGGAIVSAQGQGSVPSPTSLAPVIANLPGGTAPGSLFPQGVYAVSAYGWTVGDNAVRVGFPVRSANLQGGPATVSFDMVKVPSP